MKTCSTCGNEIPDDEWKCRYCDSYQQPGRSSRRTGEEKIKTINLKKGMPFVAEALDTLSLELELARSQGVEVLRHWRQNQAGGYTGTGIPVSCQESACLRCRGPVLRRHQPGPRPAEPIPGSRVYTSVRSSQSRNHLRSAVKTAENTAIDPRQTHSNSASQLKPK